MGVCAYALCYVPSEKARQDEQHLGDQVVESHRDLLLGPGGTTLLQGLKAEAGIIVVDEVECRVALRRLPDGPV
jgi:hypothetical protein